VDKEFRRVRSSTIDSHNGIQVRRTVVQVLLHLFSTNATVFQSSAPSHIHLLFYIVAIMKILNAVGARPNFMKIAPLMAEYSRCKNVHAILVHTGQHYGEKMSDLFFSELGIPKPDVNLKVGSGSHAVQTAEIMKRFEPVVVEHKPDAIVRRRSRNRE